MVDTIESFVTKLQQRGVDSGQEAAQKLCDEAKQKADQIIAAAEAKAKDIIAAAEKQGADILSRSQTELNLAARDTVAKLRDELTASLNALLAKASGVTLSDPKILGTILHDIVVMYTEADIKGNDLVRINVSPEIRQKLIDWAIKELGRDVVDRKKSHIELKGQLRTPGFEYHVHNGTVEVTPESVVATLSDIVTPALRDILAGVAEKSQEQ